jgi:CHAT domain-containing protein/uncharacterized protein HemY
MFTFLRPTIAFTFGITVAIAIATTSGFTVAAEPPNADRMMELEQSARQDSGKGNYAIAIAKNMEALNLAIALKDTTAEMRLTNNLANLYTHLGAYDQAIAQYQRSEAIATELKNDDHRAKVLGNLGVVYAHLSQYEKAHANHSASLKIHTDSGNLLGQSSSLINLGTLQHAQGNPKAAIPFYEKALDLVRTTPNSLQERQALNNLGLAYDNLKNYTKAIETLNQSLAISESQQDKINQASAHSNLGHAFLGAKQYDQAETALRKAVHIRDQMRQGLTDRQQISLFDTQVSTYNLLMQVLIAAKKIEPALEASEQGRAQVLAKQLAQRRLRNPESNSKLKIDQLENLAPTIAQMKQIAIKNKMTIIEYAMLPDDDFQFQGKQRAREEGLYIWVIQPDGMVHFREVNLRSLWRSKSSLTELVTTLRCGLIRSIDAEFCGEIQTQLEKEFPFTPGSELPYHPELKKLHQILIQPIVALLPTDRSAPVVLVPQESLFRLPFAALQSHDDRYLIEQHTLLTSPSIQVLNLAQTQRQRTSQTTPLIVGNPIMPIELNPVAKTAQPLAALPFAETEAKSIAQGFRTQALIQGQATKKAVVAQMPNASLIHLATHGLLNDIGNTGIPGAIALAPSPGDNGYLTSDEISQLKLNADLVVLSACDTGSGTLSGDGVVGLSRSFLTAGTSRVMVSLWQVPDDSTAALMENFYTRRSTLTDGAALREAMMTVMKRYPEPLQWAGFLLVGS